MILESYSTLYIFWNAFPADEASKAGNQLLFIILSLIIDHPE